MVKEVKKFSTFSFVFEEEKKEVKDKTEYKAIGYHLYKIIKIRLLIFFILEIILLLGCLYYVTIFCTVYHASQTNWMVDCLTGIGLSLLYSFGLALVVAILRYWAITHRSKNMFYIA